MRVTMLTPFLLFRLTRSLRNDLAVVSTIGLARWALLCLCLLKNKVMVVVVWSSP